MDMATRGQDVCNLFMMVSLLIFLCLLIVITYIYYSRDLEIEGWGKGKIRHASLYVRPFNDTSFTHADADICSDNLLVIIVVCSDTKNFKSRKAIRETWGNNIENYKIVVLFLVGNNVDGDINARISIESARYKDLIIEDFIDTYNNLTLKSIFMLKWVTNHCKHVPLLMKTDDDTYVNVTNLYKMALQVSHKELPTYLVGRLEETSYVLRSRYSKWYMPTYMYSHMLYPAYLHGPGYLMSTIVAEKLYNQSLKNEFIHLEDVYITGICAQQIKINPLNNPLFNFTKNPHLLRRCSRRWTHLVVLTHYTSVYYMYKIYKQSSRC